MNAVAANTYAQRGHAGTVHGTSLLQGFCDHDAPRCRRGRFVQNAVAYDGDDAEVLAATAFMLAWNGDHDEAVELARRRSS